jgi:hypothetical protein
LSFIGNIERLRKLIVRLGRDPEFRQAKRAFLSVVNRYEAARDHLEHLDTALIGQVDEGGPGFMGLAWLELVDEESGLRVAKFVFPGRVRSGSNPAKVYPGAVMRSDVDHFSIGVAGENYDVTAAHDALVRFWCRMRMWSAQWIPGLERRQSATGVITFHHGSCQVGHRMPATAQHCRNR